MQPGPTISWTHGGSSLAIAPQAPDKHPRLRMPPRRTRCTNWNAQISSAKLKSCKGGLLENCNFKDDLADRLGMHREFSCREGSRFRGHAVRGLQKLSPFAQSAEGHPL